MDYELFEKFITEEMKKNNIWNDEFTFDKNQNIRGQSKSIFILKNDTKIYIAKYFNYTEDIEIDIQEKDWKSLKSLNDYLLFLENNFNVNVEEISDGLELKKRCFTRYVIASNETQNVFPKINLSIEEFQFNSSIGGFLLEEAINNGLTLEECMKELTVTKTERIDEAIDFLICMSKKMYSYFVKDFVHRDLSPDNIMLTKDSYMIIDPGVIKIVSRNSTKGRVKFCKDKYSSPEQYLGYGSNVNFTSDIYILGIVLFEYITSINLIEHFYKPDTLPHQEIDNMLNRIVEDIFYDELDVEDQTIDRLYLIIKKMLQCKKDDRFSTPESFLETIETLSMKGVKKND